MVEIAQGARKVIRFETRRGDGALVDPDNFNSAVQASWPDTIVKDYLGNVLAWKPAGTEGDDPNMTGLYRYGTGQWGQAVVVPTAAAIRADYRLRVEDAPPYGIGGATYSGETTFAVVIAGSVSIPPAGLVDRAYVLRVIGPQNAESYGYTTDADRDALVDDAILAATALVQRETSRSFAQESRTAFLNVFNSDDFAVHVGRSPISGVSSVKENGVALVLGTDYSWDVNGFLYRHDSRKQPRAWKRGVSMVEVGYTEGETTVPEDIKWAVARIVEALLLQKMATRKGPYIEFGDMTLEVPAVPMLPREVQRVLAAHKRLFAGVV